MTLEKDADVLLTFFDFPAEHWKHLRTSNVVEPHGAEHHSFTGVRMGAALAFSSTTTNLAGSVLLALRPTT